MQPNEIRIIVIGDGPTGLSAALFLAKNKFHVDVVGLNQTPVHKALLHNYLADDAQPGPDVIRDARNHATQYGAALHDAKVERIELGDTFRAHTSARSFEGQYLVLATGFDNSATKDLGLKTGPDGVQVDRSGRTSHDRIYAGGALARGTKTQVVTSVGDGAAIALDIISSVKGQPAHDWDVLKQRWLDARELVQYFLPRFEETNFIVRGRETQSWSQSLDGTSVWARPSWAALSAPSSSA